MRDTLFFGCLHPHVRLFSLVKASFCVQVPYSRLVMFLDSYLTCAFTTIFFSVPATWDKDPKNITLWFTLKLVKPQKCLEKQKSLRLKPSAIFVSHQTHNQRELCKRFPEGKPPFSYGFSYGFPIQTRHFPMVNHWFSANSISPACSINSPPPWFVWGNFPPEKGLILGFFFLSHPKSLFF